MGKSNVQQMIDEALLKREPTINLTGNVLLCSACRVLERLGYDFDENPLLSQWWDAHKKQDAKQGNPVPQPNSTLLGKTP